ncbi:hypothetical protein IE81DRAFT_326361 [Ceraceosorus guamensis]|uniref:C2 domain-containing protein n=1 Tax=Ceraceosorus guamensis TaxID=1522189 RepID=A0A316VPY8_9BASI|nr:hypothetical protein IE81DRAFT_326361 [Ceraceosorus guamensis]PWN39592.1 hypothetical protein IE81DRAFT_326361 [Ceraceosorus guamensis]
MSASRAPPSAGTQHHASDYYSATNPIPTIQRYFDSAWSEVLSGARGETEGAAAPEGESKEALQAEETDLGQSELDTSGSEEEDEDDESVSEGQHGRRAQSATQRSEANGSKDASGSSRRSLSAKGTARLSSLPFFGRRSKQRGESEQANSKASTGPSRTSEEQKAPAQPQRRAKGARAVIDPVTQREMKIRDVGRVEFARKIKREDALELAESEAARQADGSKGAGADAAGGSDLNLGREDLNMDEEADHQAQNGLAEQKRWTGTSTEARQRRAELRKARAERRMRRSVLSKPFPPGPEIHLSRNIIALWAAWSSLLLAVSFVGKDQRSITTSTLLLLLILASNAWLGWYTFKQSVREAEHVRWARERQRALGHAGEAERASHQQAALPIAQTLAHALKDGALESVEWLNALVRGFWSTADPAMFASMGGTLEDIMAASVPGFIHGVKVEECAQGDNPIRITAVRILKDAESDSMINEKTGGGAGQVEEEEQRSKGAPTARPEESPIGSYVNLEMSLIYRALPSHPNSLASRNKNAHLLIHFFIGVKKWLQLPLPVYVEIVGFVATVRVRVQLLPDPPFVGNVTFCFKGLPRCSVDVSPLSFNLSNVPVLSGFIQTSIDAAVGEYVAPSSMTMDVGKMLAGDQIKREVDALGVIVVYFHRAFDLEKQDRNGSSDPYCTICWSRLQKVIYCTRVALDDLSPVWEERCVFLLHSEILRAKEKIQINLWDSDRLTADDLLGRVEVDTKQLVENPGKLFRRKDTLMGLTHQMSKQGTVEWSVGFFKKADNRVRRGAVDEAVEKRESQAEESNKMRGKETRRLQSAPGQIEGAVQASEERDSRPTELSRPEGTEPKRGEEGVRFQPPDPNLPAGILSVQVHQASGLELVDTRTKAQLQLGHRTSLEPAQKAEDWVDEQDDASSPSAYFSIILNDQVVFRSRTKLLSANPFFQAGTERWVRDWRRCLIMVELRDKRNREKDPILGVVPIKLCELFKESGSSQVTQWFSIGGGVGRGMVRLSLLFRPVKGLDTVHKEKLGFDIGTCQLHSSIRLGNFEDPDYAQHLHRANLRIRTLVASIKISGRKHSVLLDGDDGEMPSRQQQSTSSGLEWRLAKSELPLRVPARRRYAAPLVFEFRSRLRRLLAVSIIWLQDVIDDEFEDVQLPIWVGADAGRGSGDGGDLHRLMQNYSNYKDQAEGEALGARRIGTLCVRLRFKSGVGRVHARFDKNPESACVLEAWRAAVAAGLRSADGDFVERMDSEDEEGYARGEEEDASSDSDSDSDSDSAAAEERGEMSASRGKRRQGVQYGDELTEEPQALKSPRSSVAKEQQQQQEDEEEEEEECKEGLMDKLREWKREREELGRRHMGAKRYKAVRTASWLGDSAKKRISRSMDMFSLEDRRFGQVESEM